MTQYFHQSYAKDLLNGCPGQLAERLRHGKPNHAMTLGTVVDQLALSGRRDYHVIKATYKSGKRKGEPVSSWTPDALKEKLEVEDAGDGRVVLLQKDVARVEAAAARVRSELLKRGIDLTSPECIVQKTVTWVGRDGVKCEGTPDIVERAEEMTVDLKYGEECDPRALRRMIWNMCWDVQGSAYQEAYAFRSGKHCIARASDSCFVMVTLTPFALSIGHDRLDHARRIWRQCVRDDAWPWWEDCTVDPPDFEVERWMARAGASK